MWHLRGDDTQGGSLMHPHACIDAKKIIAKDRAKNAWVCECNVELSPEKLRSELQKGDPNHWDSSLL